MSGTGGSCGIRDTGAGGVNVRNGTLPGPQPVRRVPFDRDLQSAAPQIQLTEFQVQLYTSYARKLLIIFRA